MAYGVKVDEHGTVIATLETSGEMPSGYTVITDNDPELREAIERRSLKYVQGQWTEPAVSVRQVSPLQFALLFTADERIAIRKRRAAGDAAADQLEDFFGLLELAGPISLASPIVAAGLGLLEAHGLIDAKRRADILRGTVPA